VRSVDGDAALVYVPGAGAVDPGVAERVRPRDTVLWDGTFWTDDELVRLGISERRAADMSHLPISGPEGSLERFRMVRTRRKAYIHINNTNPILRAGSPERRAVEAAGWEVACDGMEFEI
jgi:pyrroloquinoline quinone biosynthesis protein B